MISIPYFRQIVKSNAKFLIAFTSVLCMFLVVMNYVFTPEIVNEFHSATNETFISNIFASNGTLVGFMSNSFYAMMAIIFPMVYSIMVGNRMIAEKIDKGSMVGYLSTPTTRLKIVLTSAVYFVVSIFLMWGITSIIGILTANYFQPGALDTEIFLILNFGAFLYHLVISGICFCSSCIFNTSKKSLIFGAGIPLFFFVISMFIRLSGDLDFLKYVTLNTLFDAQSILSGGGYSGNFIVMTVIAAVLYVVGIFWFKKKDLPM